MNCAVIVDNRPVPKSVIDNHMDHLPGWDLMDISDVEIKNGADYNDIMTNSYFWITLKKYEKVLIFQHDSGILREGIDEFLDYDFVGSPWLESAPWARKDRAGGNGGISIRDVGATLELLNREKYNARYGNEDVWYVHNLGNVAPYEVCVKFGVETEYQLGTFCWHQIDNYLTKEQCNEIRNQYNTNG